MEKLKLCSMEKAKLHYIHFNKYDLEYELSMYNLQLNEIKQQILIVKELIDIFSKSEDF